MATTVEIFRHRRNINPVLERAPRDLYMIVALFDENHTYLVSVDGRNHVNQVGIIVATITRTLAIFQREGAPDNAIFLFHARKPRAPIAGCWKGLSYQGAHVQLRHVYASFHQLRT